MTDTGKRSRSTSPTLSEKQARHSALPALTDPPTAEASESQLQETPAPFPADVPIPVDQCEDLVPPVVIAQTPEDDIILPPVPDEHPDDAERDKEEETNDADDETMSVTQIRTLTALYSTGKMVAATSQAYPFNEAMNAKLSLWRGDITSVKVDAIVNAANSSLLGGGGIDGAIHRAAGPSLLAECRTLGGCPTGGAKITKGYRLPAKHVIHTVGPIYSSREKDKKERELRSCYKRCFELMHEHKLKTVALCGVSTGIYGYPLDAATCVALDETRTFLASAEAESVERIIFTVFRQIDVDSYVDLIPEYFPPPPSSLASSSVDAAASSATAQRLSSLETRDVDSDSAPPFPTTKRRSAEPVNQSTTALGEAATSPHTQQEATDTGKMHESAASVTFEKANLPLTDNSSATKQSSMASQSASEA